MLYELSVRKSSWGPGVIPVRPRREEFGDPDPLDSGRRMLNFFVHGFNNDSGRMEDTWRRTVARLRKHQDLGGKYLDNVVLFYWPGELFRSNLLSAPFYSLIVKDAKKSAKELVWYLHKKAPKDGGLTINFVGHSLGCLVILETLRLLDKSLVNVRRVLLMAAAVQVGRCLRGLEYGSKIGRQYEEVLFSSKDRVLQLCFPVGQLGAGDYSTLSSQAVGRWGGPVDRWRLPVRNTGYGHGDYWEKWLSINRIVHLLKDQPNPKVNPSRQMPERHEKTREEVRARCPRARYK